MATFKPPFAYNTGGPISGTTQYGDFVIGNIEVDYGSDYGGVKWWAAPEEITGYVIGNARPGGQPVPPGVTGIANVGFWRSKGRTDEAFLDLANYIGFKNGQPPFTTTNDAKIWLESNGCYTNYVPSTPTPTPTLELTPTVTPTNTSTETQTPTPTNTSTQTQTPTPSITASQTQTPTPSITESQTQTPTPSITESQTQTPTPSITASQTQTPTNTSTQTQTPTPSITASQTQTPTNTSTQTQTPTPSITASQTQTPTPSITASQTQTPTPSITASQTQTPTPSITASQTQTPTPSITASQTQTPTQTPTTSFITGISYSIGYNTNNGGGSYGGYSTPLDSCVSGIPNIVKVYSVNTVGNGTVLYLDAARTQPFISSGGYFIATGGIGIQFYFTYTSSSSDITNCDTLPSQTPTNTPTQTQTPTNTPTSDPTPTPTNTETPTSTPTPTQALTDVTINIGTQNSADGSGEITVYAYTSGNTNVDTNVVVGFKWVGDLFSEINGTITITNGTSCGNNTFAGAEIGENISTFEITSITPTSSGAQSYSSGSADYPITACP